MNIGLIGLPGSGKTTVFNALTRMQAQIGAYGGAKSEPNRAIIEVADDRLTTLSWMYEPKKTTHAVIELIDFSGLSQGSAREGLFSSASVGQIKNSDAVALVICHFPDEIGQAPSPLVDIEKLEEELLISDLIVCENRLERIETAYKRGKKASLLQAEEKVLRRITEQLGTGRPIRELDLSAEALKTIRGFQFLTQKPVMVIINSDEDRFGKEMELLRETGKSYRTIEFAGKFEMELSQLTNQEDIALFMADMGIEESASGRLCRAAYDLLGYISFFTVGSDEVRAWSVRRGESALTAAGTIHSDLARGFIRAGCMTYDDLVSCGSEKQVAEMGLLRVEGKNYTVQDGDILNIRFNV